MGRSQASAAPAAAAGHAKTVDSSLANSSPLRGLLTAATVVAVLCALALILAPVGRTAPVHDIAVDFDWEPATPTAGQTVRFRANVSPPDGVGIKSINWDLSGDGKADANGESPTWTYRDPTMVSVRLRVKGDGNHRGEVIHTVTVRPRPGDSRQPPLAAFTVSPGAPMAGQPVNFTSTASDP